jgi:hypothetical protein
MSEYIGLEKDLVRWFRESLTAGQTDLWSDAMPLSSLDTAVYEMSFKFGRADIVVFHIDGSASVIEAKDGTRGYNHVVAGIGQAGLYAAQLGMNRGALTKVRRCLMWTSTGDLFLDLTIEDVCKQAGIVPMSYGKMSTHIAAENAVYAHFGRERV